MHVTYIKMHALKGQQETHVSNGDHNNLRYM